MKVVWIDEGSHVPCGPSTGCKVYAPDSTAQTGSFVTITGITSTELYDPTPGAPGDKSYIRVVMPVSPTALQTIAE